MTNLANQNTVDTAEKNITSLISTNGTAITIDPESGNGDTLIINASYGIGSTVQKSIVCPDEYQLFKPFIQKEGCDAVISRTLGTKSVLEIPQSDPAQPYRQELTNFNDQNRFALSLDEISALGETILKEVGLDEAVEIEWSKEAGSNIFQIKSISPTSYNTSNPSDSLTIYQLDDSDPHVITKGVGISNQIINGSVIKMNSPDEAIDIPKNSILVIKQLDSTWRPILDQVSGIIANDGGRCCQGSSLIRELNIPAVLGTKNATNLLKDNQEITLDCSHSKHGFIYSHHLRFNRSIINLKGLPNIYTRRLLSIDNPNMAELWHKLPDQGFGIAKIEDILTKEIGVHPQALLEYNEIEDDGIKRKIDHLTAAYENHENYFVDKLARGIAHMAACAWPRPCVVRLNDLTTNEYKNLIDRGAYEPIERNPKLGLRGASRYLSEDYKPSFKLECQALHKVHHEMGYRNVDIAIPFCRTLNGAREVISILSEHGLKRGEDGINLHLIAEVPSNIIISHEFMRLFDCLDIDLDVLTQMILDIDPDDQSGSKAFDHLDSAVLTALKTLTDEAHCAGVRVTIFGLLQDHRKELIDSLLSMGIDAFAFEPENFIRGSLQLAKGEKSYYTQKPINPNQA